MTYPAVVGESQTLDRVVAGASIARYGDGEFKLMRGHSIKSQRHDPRLADRLREILQGSGSSCLVGIPNIHSETPKADFWRPFLAYADLLRPGVDYVSSFISRPDSAPWVDTPEYWARLQSLWIDRDVTLVYGSWKGLTPFDLYGAREITEVRSDYPQHAWQDWASLIRRIGHPDRVLMCLGPTATVLAADLDARGVHAIDLGHVALFLRKHRAGRPMTLTKDDKR